MDTSHDDVISLEHVWVSYNESIILKDISLQVKNKDFLGIIGPNGGGKTTLIKTMIGLIKPHNGRVKILGQDPNRSRKHIGYVAQKNYHESNFPISVFEVVRMGLCGKKGFLKRYSSKDDELVLQTLKVVGMTKHSDKEIGHLSGGEQQRIFIARALINNPKILLLDEPDVGIDANMQSEFYSLLKKLNKNMTIILVSHDLSAISKHVKKVACINQEIYYHDSKEIKREDIEKAYGCPIDLIAHGVPHRVLEEHE